MTTKKSATPESKDESPSAAPKPVASKATTAQAEDKAATPAAPAAQGPESTKPTAQQPAPPAKAATSAASPAKPASAPAPAPATPASAPKAAEATAAPASTPKSPPADEHAHPKTHRDESARGRGARLFSDLDRPVHSRSIVIQNVSPALDDGRYAIKRVVGDRIDVSAEVFREGHDKLRAVILYRREQDKLWKEAPLTEQNHGLAIWNGTIELTVPGRWLFTIEAWPDVYESWCSEVEKKHGAGQDVSLELQEGLEYLEEAIKRCSAQDATWLRATLDMLRDTEGDTRTTFMIGQEMRAVMSRWPDRSTAIRFDREVPVYVDRREAVFAAWYEMFHRSQGTVEGRSATFKDCEARLPAVRALGFDVVYFPPIHPIGKAFRKGPNNTLNAGPDDPGSPYAIGSEEGGHKAVHPDLGTLEDFRHFVKACNDEGMEVALDFAIQCSPDHPWIREHPEWFLFRPDGSIKYAENPPKKYQDIVNVDFYCEQWHDLWEELKDIVEFWIEQGVKIFRVDNPHTKPVPFWEWLIGDLQSKYPDVLFLAEAFTRPPMLYMLGKIGYSQSYTYFTWRHTKAELTEYLTEITQPPVSDYMRPNFFVNTPDINPPYLQTGGRPAHMIRLVLAATLSGVYGIYNGFELCEATPVPGKEEFLNSEKYEYKVWDWDRPGNIKDYIAKVNWLRGENPALQEMHNLRFYFATDDNILFYGKMTADKSNVIFVAVNLDPFAPHESFIEFPLAELGFGEQDLYSAVEQFSGRRLEWRGARQWIRLDPFLNPCEIFKIAMPGH